VINNEEQRGVGDGTAYCKQGIHTAPYVKGDEITAKREGGKWLGLLLY